MRRLPNLASEPLLNTRPVWVYTAVVAVLVVALAALDLHLHLNAGQTTAALRARRAELETRRQRLAASVAAAAARLDRVRWGALGRKVAGYNRVLAGHRFSWTALLADLGATLPRDVRLTRVSPEVGPEGVTLTLGGVARTREAMLRFLENLVASPVFAEPVPRSEETPEGAGVAGYVFRLRVTYRQEGSR